MIKALLVLLTSILLFGVGCAPEIKTDPVPSVIVSFDQPTNDEFRSLDPAFTPKGILLFQISGTGGCAWGGNRCEHNYIFDDGKFITKRLGTDLIISYGQIDKDLLDNWQKTIDYKRLTKVFKNLGEGRCNSCVDGIDTYYWLYTAGGVLTVNSLEKGFTDDVFFKYSAEIQKAIWENSNSLSLHEPK